MHLSVFFASLSIGYALAHMQLVSPAPFNSSNNPHRITGADPYLQYPYDCCGPNDRWVYPCRGYLDLLDTPEGAPTVDWPAGSVQTWSISGIGNHWGGSCQVGFSGDRGKHFHAVTSYEGNCPHRSNGNGPAGQHFDFKVPEDLPVGIQVFAWIWFNREQEFNMNCAAVNITAPEKPASAMPSYTSSSFDKGATSILPLAAATDVALASGLMPFRERPLMLVADNGNGCLTPKTTAEVKYPYPGPDIVIGDSFYPLELPVGKCGAPEMLAKQAYDGSMGSDGHE